MNNISYGVYNVYEVVCKQCGHRYLVDHKSDVQTVKDLHTKHHLDGHPIDRRSRELKYTLLELV